MNERIKKLAEQAMETVDVSEKLGMPGTDLVFNKEKFAELILKDCVAVIAEDLGSGMDHSDFSDGMTWGLRMAINSIKEHFGVEE